MERYGRATTEGSQSDPSPEGLEEAGWPLGFGGGSESYPERPDEADCIFYLRTGYCGYGSRCRFNHPRDRQAVPGAGRGGDGEFPERTGQPICQYYMRTGTCKFGSSCKYHHPRLGGGSASILLNYLGYPIRQGERECSYYVKTGQCKFGPSCKFHHPQPAGLQLPLQTPAPQPPPAPAMFPPPVQSPSGSSSQQYNLMVARPSLLQGQFVQSPYGTVLISPGMVPYPGWPGTPYMPSVSPLPSPSYQLPSSGPPFHGSYQPNPSQSVNQMSGQKEPAFPERPGQPECQYYLRTGDCKFGSSCRYHHPPPEAIPPSPTVTLSPAGLPIRQGAPLCIHYAQRGVCKFGPSCRFDHPVGTLSYSPSASSLSDMPVAPYPVGSSVGTLAPSSSSSDLHPLGATKDSPSSARMSSSMSSSSGSVGSTFSKGSTVHSSPNVGAGTESRTSS